MKPILDEEKRGSIRGILAVGGTYQLAAKYVGCDRRTIHRTANRDPLFREQLQKAKSGTEFQFLHTIKEAGKETKYWQAAKSALEHMYPDRYARKPRTMALADVKDLISQLISAIVKVVPDSTVRNDIRLQIRMVSGAAMRKVKEQRREK